MTILIFSRIGIISEVDIHTIARMTGGWIRALFLFKHPNDMDKVTNEVLFGYITHNIIGVSTR